MARRLSRVQVSQNTCLRPRSMAVLQVVLYLEQNYGLDFSVLGVDAEELGTIGNILDMIERNVGA